MMKTKHIEKNLITCKPSEFLKQTMRLKRTAEKWLKDIKFAEIRKQLPDLENIEGDTEKAIQEQALKNLSAILENAFEKYPDETLEVIALCCFIEPEDVDEYPTGEYLKTMSEMIHDEAVLTFFSSLVQLGQMLTRNQ